MQRTLRALRPGESGKIDRVTGSGCLRRRILDMGLTRGTTITVRKAAPLGDPIEVTVRGYELTIRKSEADCVLIS